MPTIKKHMQTIKLMDIVIDPNIQVREVEDHTVSKYAQAMRAGSIFPPLLLEKGTNRVVCGNNRYHAYRRVLPPEAEITVEFRKFNNEAEIIREAARDNARHGRPLDTWDQKRIAARLRGLGDSPEQIAETLSVPVSKIENWAGMTVLVVGNKGKSKHVAQPQPVKHGLEHLAGQKVDAARYEEHKRHDPGTPVKNMAAVILRHLRSGFINTDDKRTMENLTMLHEELGAFLKKEVAA